MNSDFKGLKKTLLTTTGTVGLLLALRALPISPIIGSSFSFFSVADVLMPLSGLLGMSYALVAVIFRVAFRMIILKAPMYALFYHIPGLCAAAVWYTESKIVQLVLPVICMAAFIAHPIGSQVPIYSMYWLIPVLLFFVRRNIFFKALSSTFIAHAVGSVIWLYSFALPVETWRALIPVVAVERITFACCMVVVYGVVQILFAMGSLKMGRCMHKRGLV